MSARTSKYNLKFALISLFLPCNVCVVDASQSKGDFEDKFRQLDEILPTPNDYRNAAGEPGSSLKFILDSLDVP